MVMGQIRPLRYKFFFTIDQHFDKQSDASGGLEHLPNKPPG
jgi:hypothetical protein